MYPVVIGLVLMAFWTVLYSGVFCRALITRGKEKNQVLTRFITQHQTELDQALAQTSQADILLTKMLRVWEKKQIDKLDRIRFIIKTGPSLGLIGTLIPMGTSLASLSQGDMMAMSTNMVTAFTTTIVGIACGMIAYLIAMTQEKWLKADFLTCEIYCETRLRELPSSTAQLTDHEK